LHFGGRLRRVAAVAEHRVDRIEALPRAALRPFAIERDAEREHFPRGREATRGGDALRRDVVQRPDLVVRAPLPPVTHRKGDLPQRFFAHDYFPAAGAVVAAISAGRGSPAGWNATTIGVG